MDWIKNKSHPSVEIIFLLVLAVVLWRSSLLTAVVSAVVLFILWIYRIPMKKLYRYTVGAIWIVAILIVISYFSTGHIGNAILTGYRFLLVITTLSLLSIIMSPFDLTYGIVRILKPLSFLHFPVSELSFVLSMSLRFIPLMSEEIERIILSQRVRGFDIKNFKEVVAVGYSILVPVFASATIKAEAMAISLYLRGVDVKKGIPPVRKVSLGYKDLFLIVVSVVLVVMAYA